MSIKFEVNSSHCNENMAEGEPAKDTLPKRGRVTEVCREWSVKEDGALAYKLQNEEIESHYTGNKSRNAQVREDFPCARDEQQRVQEEAALLYARQVMEQEERDSRVAKQLAERIEYEERLRKQALELEDADIARKLQERERLHIERKERERKERERTEQYDHAMNSVGLPLPPEPHVHANGKAEVVLSMSQQVRQLSLQEVLQEDRDARRIQEEQDAELARRLQEEESGDSEAAMLDQDRLMAIEAQDKELARLLQERLDRLNGLTSSDATKINENVKSQKIMEERAKAKRARERARQKALLKKQQEEGTAASPSSQSTDWPDQEGELNQRPIRDQEDLVRAIRPTDLDLTGARNKSRAVDLEAIEVLDSTGYSAGNIAMAIDPTYPRRATATNCYAGYSPPDIYPGSNVSSPAISLPPPDFEDDIPPYMPIQGQRRIATLEKKSKKGKVKKEGKEGNCKQQ